MRIAIISDTHLCEVGRAFNDNCAAAITWIDAAAVDLVVHLGDVTADGVQQRAHFETARRILGGLKAPIRYLPGNHDIGDNPADTDPTHEPLVDAGSLGAFRAAFGDDRWAFSQDGWSLIGLNAQLFGRGDALERDQFDWLAAVSAAAPGRIALFLHKPLFRETPDDEHRNPRFAPRAACRRLLDLMAPHDWRLAVSGHVHQWRRHTVAGVEHVWAPSCAFVVPDLVQPWIGEKTVGLVLLELEPGGHGVSLHHPPGVLHHDLTDHAEVYPQLTGMLAELRARQAG